MEGNLSPEIATRSQWENYPIDQSKRIKIDLQFSKEQVEKMKNGLVPHQMEDKWFIFYEEEWLYFHRSWTGFGIYKTKIIKEEDGYSVKEFYVERNKEKYNSDKANDDIETFLILISVGLLHIPSSKVYSVIDKNVGDDNALQKWSQFGRMLFS